MTQKQKINVAELLKYCPKGMELDCTMIDNVVFEKLDVRSSHHPIIIRRTDSKDSNTTIHLTKYGQYSDEEDYKCVIFPKGKTTWEGFVPPCKFKDGDVLAFDDETIVIFKDLYNNTSFHSYCHIENGIFTISKEDMPDWWRAKGFYPATEEQCTLLFRKIKEAGYHWNAETKTLEKLIVPKFKVGDRVRNKNYKDYTYDIHDITDKGYRAKEINADSPIIILFGSQEDNYELVPNKFDITTLKPFESKVLVRDTVKETWKPDFFGCLYDSNDCPYMVVGGIRWKCCIPYEGNEHLLGTTDDCDEYFKTW